MTKFTDAWHEADEREAGTGETVKQGLTAKPRKPVKTSRGVPEV